MINYENIVIFYFLLFILYFMTINALLNSQCVSIYFIYVIPDYTYVKPIMNYI